MKANESNFAFIYFHLLAFICTGSSRFALAAAWPTLGAARAEGDA
jgi:hypothetical protein